MDKKWHVVVDGVQKGPLAPVAIQAMFNKGIINGESMLWCQGMPEWKRMRHVMELSYIILGEPDPTVQQPQVQAPPQQPTPHPAAPTAQPTMPAAKQPGEQVAAQTHSPAPAVQQSPQQNVQQGAIPDSGVASEQGDIEEDIINEPESIQDKAMALLYRAKTWWTHKDEDMTALGEKEEILPDQVRGFNLGAFLLTPIWCIVHGLWYVTVGMVVVQAFVPYGWIASMLASVVFGIIGNQITLQRKHYRNLAEFKQVQRIWAIAGVAAVAILSVVVVLVVYKPFDDSEDRKMCEEALGDVRGAFVQYKNDNYTFEISNIDDLGPYMFDDCESAEDCKGRVQKHLDSTCRVKTFEYKVVNKGEDYNIKAKTSKKGCSMCCTGYYCYPRDLDPIDENVCLKEDACDFLLKEGRKAYYKKFKK